MGQLGDPNSDLWEPTQPDNPALSHLLVVASNPSNISRITPTHTHTHTHITFLPIGPLKISCYISN